MELIRPLLPSKYSPLQTNGNGMQSGYLSQISEELADRLVGLADAVFPNIPPATDPDPPEEIVAQEEELANLQGRMDVGEVERAQLANARRGQGIFRTNVRMNETRCRVTGITDPAHLRASHIAPWKDCTNVEKLRGCHGLLLAPHVDHLFDRGWISFTDDGDLLVGKGLSLALLQPWGIPAELNVGPFSQLQARFLNYHRTQVFRT
jgi:hypothetical protein